MLPEGEPMQAPVPALDLEHLRAWNMRRMRTDRKMNVKTVHELTGISETFIMEMERCTRSISIKTVDRLAKGLKLASWQVLAELDRPA